MPLNVWIENYKKAAKEYTEPVSLTLIGFKACIRPTNEQKMDVITTLEAVQGLKSENLAVVFTFCDTINMETTNANGVLKYRAWIDTIGRFVKNQDPDGMFQDLPDDRLLLFKSTDCQWGPATTTEQLHQFIAKHAAKDSNATMNAELTVA